MSSWEFVRRVVMAVAAGLLVIGVGLLVFELVGFLLVVFAGILLAVVLHSASRRLSYPLRVPRGVALAIVLLASIVLLGGGTWLAGPPVVEQTQELVSRIPETVSEIRSDIERSQLGGSLLEAAGSLRQAMPDGGDMLGRITGVFSTAFSAVVNVVVILFVGLYLAASPDPYLNAVVRLFPPGERSLVKEILCDLGRALAWWTVGRLASMAIVGLLTYIGLQIVGAPLPLALGFIAGLLSFVPILGPVAASVPAILLAWGEGFGMAVTVLIVYLIVQALESYLVTPMIEREVVSLPPAAVIVGQVLIGSLAGVVGVFLSTPLIVAVTVLVQTLYIEQVLHEPVRVLGER